MQSSRRRVWRVLRFLGGVVAIAVVAAGVPAVLWMLGGNPLPSRVPTLAEVEAFMETGDAAQATVVKVVAGAGWCAWAWLMVTVILEAFAALRGRERRRLRGGGPFHGLAAVLVAGLGIGVSGATGPGNARGAGAVLPRSPVAVEVVLAPAAFVIESPSVEDSAPSPAEHVVRRRDDLWGIAESRLGDGSRWRDIFELNQNRPQPDGGRLERPDQALRPGWRLMLPSGHSAVQPPTQLDALATGETVVVERGDTLWAIAGDHLDDPRRWPEVFDLNQGLAQPDGGELLDADLIQPGWSLELPADAEDASASDDAVASEVAPPPSEQVGAASDALAAPSDALAPPVHEIAPTAPAPQPTDAAAERDGDGTEVIIAGLLGIAATGIAVGVGRNLTRRRRRRLLHLAPGFAPTVPPSQLTEVRSDLVLASDEHHMAMLRGAMRSLSLHFGEQRGANSRPRLVQASAERIEVFFSEPRLPTAPGWTPEASGAVWVLDGCEVPEHAEDVAPCAPTLVTLGRPESSGQAYFDLEAEGVLAVTGDAEEATAFVRSVVVELANPAAGAPLALTVVGDLGDSEIAQLDGVCVVETWKEVEDEALAWARQSQALLAANRWPSPFVARGNAPDHDGLTPLVIVCAHCPDDPSFEEFASLVAAGDTTASLVILGEVPVAATRIEVDGGELTLPGMGFTCRGQAVGSKALGDVVELLENAHRVTEAVPVVPAIRSSADGGEPYEDPAFEVLVRLLGDIEVVGGSRPLTPKQTAAVAYMSLHSPVSIERLEDAVWTAATQSRRRRLFNTLSACRTALGAQHLPVAMDGAYSVGPNVVTDVDLFERRITYAATRPETEAALILRGALELVSGPVFTYPSKERASFVWVDVENWISTWELKVTETATRLAELSFESGDTDTVIWAAERGLVTSPTHPALIEALMRAHASRGERAIAEQVYVSHVAALEGLGIDEVAESTLHLHEEIRRSEEVVTAATG